MQFLMLVYTDEALLEALPPAEYDVLMRGCLEHADDLRTSGKLLDSAQLEKPVTARTMRVRSGQATIVDGPFAETKEQLAGFYILDCASLDDAIRYAAMIPGAAHGAVEVRPIMVFDR